MAENQTLIGEFPKNITGTKQYGNNLKAYAAALSTVGMVGIDRIHELLTGVFDISVSTGSIQNWIKQLSSATKEATTKIRERISRLRVLNCDETGLRVNGSLHWLHCLCNENWSYLALHKKRGSKAMDEMDILPGFRNTMVHDFWKPYTKFVVACIILLNVLAVYCYGFCDRMSIIIYYAKIRNISVQYRRTGYSTSK